MMHDPNLTLPEGIFISYRDPQESEGMAVSELLKSITHAAPALAHHPSGAPYLPKYPEQTISISHSDHLVAIGLVAEREAHFGIDIEEKEDQAARLLVRYSTAIERQLLKSFGLSPLLLWCAKEAAYKAYSKQITRFSSQLTLTNATSEAVSIHIQPSEGPETSILVRYHQLPNGALLTYTTPHSTPLPIRWISQDEPLI
ncbi:MAG: 4'-phosphopantetheinyl transferase superfamily protein [Porphyromonas sp.]|nr:4'-phosphopantetheinyl transferase superfamily protein [Porphyromonas sp.]